MVVSDFYQKRIFLDTAPLIYFIEGHSPHQDKLIQCFNAIDNNRFVFISSSITLLEVLVRPLKEGKPKLVTQYKKILLNANGIEIFEISNKIAERAAELRAKYALKTPDALQIATAIEYDVDYFLTNDYRLNSIKEIDIVTLADLK